MKSCMHYEEESGTSSVSQETCTSNHFIKREYIQNKRTSMESLLNDSSCMRNVLKSSHSIKSETLYLDKLHKSKCNRSCESFSQSTANSKANLGKALEAAHSKLASTYKPTAGVYKTLIVLPKPNNSAERKAIEKTKINWFKLKNKIKPSIFKALRSRIFFKNHSMSTSNQHIQFCSLHHTDGFYKAGKDICIECLYRNLCHCQKCALSKNLLILASNLQPTKPETHESSTQTFDLFDYSDFNRKSSLCETSAYKYVRPKYAYLSQPVQKYKIYRSTSCQTDHIKKMSTKRVNTNTLIPDSNKFCYPNKSSATGRKVRKQYLNSSTDNEKNKICNLERVKKQEGSLLLKSYSSEFEIEHNQNSNNADKYFPKVSTKNKVQKAFDQNTNWDILCNKMDRESFNCHTLDSMDLGVLTISKLNNVLLKDSMFSSPLSGRIYTLKHNDLKVRLDKLKKNSCKPMCVDLERINILAEICKPVLVYDGDFSSKNIEQMVDTAAENNKINEVNYDKTEEVGNFMKMLEKSLFDKLDSLEGKIVNLLSATPRNSNHLSNTRSIIAESRKLVKQRSIGNFSDPYNQEEISFCDWHNNDGKWSEADLATPEACNVNAEEGFLYERCHKNEPSENFVSSNLPSFKTSISDTYKIFKILNNKSNDLLENSSLPDLNTAISEC